MKKIFALLLVSVVIMIGETALAIPVFETIGDVKYDFGTVDQGTLIEHEFKYRNAGDDTLHILNVKAT